MKLSHYILFVLFCTTGLSILAQDKSQKETKNKLTPSDLAWERLQSIPRPLGGSISSMSRDSLIRYWVAREIYNRKYRELGIEFFKKFPNDFRRYDWLIETMTFPPRYWLDITEGVINYYFNKNPHVEVDTKRIKEWGVVLSNFGDEVSLNPLKNGKDYKKIFLVLQLRNFLEDGRNRFYRDSDKVDLRTVIYYLKEIIEKYDYYGHGFDRRSLYNPKFVGIVQLKPLTVSNWLFSRAQDYGLESKDLRSFVDSLRQSSSPQLQKWAREKAFLLDSYNKPFAFKAPAMNGQFYDLEKLRGKVVFLDFWATTCSPCIAMMPRLKIIYEKYKAQGFEVLSIAVDPKERIENIRKIKERIGADWPTFVIGGENREEFEKSLAKQIFDMYGLSSVPAIFLIDKNGHTRFFGTTNTLNTEFEPLLKNLLAE